ncbi:BrnA antitoxin family protein [Aurantimonas sp. C2-6-R+9]|uniref:BrnA antitoxin family protein n=1 Tax=unclassified Aurantimonas TaxID=2638230 RepID=UPI002E179491|nr:MULTISPECIES: BrnA antitoxin family protein [unclassified Aurantimonas]MEC5289735.1 BrnA antitoxin family protein [Aurantimonas sp. C2-3-R2]MEC5322302.1 BrnA antitoxin family protein [Aurantimonas sp. A3-2-R12]MEC5379701.1 BrnA antitoxin family protein [Aurantimonas sp. C2-6-R+9]MEC5410828.1 BrnA antitoxin family protein [Aurantimonas sp. C2-4-R8]
MARRPTNPRDAAEAAFKSATTTPERMKESLSAIPTGREMVSLRIDRDVLAHFQEDGPGWQERINAALRKSAGL